MERFTLGEKLNGVALLGFGGGCCGPGLFILFSLVIYLLISIPFLVFNADPPQWMAALSMIAGAVLTVLILVGAVLSEMDKRRKKRE